MDKFMNSFDKAMNERLKIWHFLSLYLMVIGCFIQNYKIKNQLKEVKQLTIIEEVEKHYDVDKKKLTIYFE